MLVYIEMHCILVLFSSAMFLFCFQCFLFCYDCLPLRPVSCTYFVRLSVEFWQCWSSLYKAHFKHLYQKKHSSFSQKYLRKIYYSSGVYQWLDCNFYYQPSRDSRLSEWWDPNLEPLGTILPRCSRVVSGVPLIGSHCTERR